MRRLSQFIASERGEISADTIALAGGLVLLALALSSNIGGVRGGGAMRVADGGVMRVADGGASPAIGVMPPIRNGVSKAAEGTAMSISTRQ